MNRTCASAAMLVAICVGVARADTPVGSAFTYQGQLKQDGQPANGSFAMEFTLWDEPGSENPPTGGNQIGPALRFDGGSAPLVAVADGLFTVVLDFGPEPFAGGARWLAISVEGSALAPRQPLSVAPYALYALNGPAGGASDRHSLDASDGSPIDAVYVNEAGNVGVGTSSPAAPLHVVGVTTGPDSGVITAIQTEGNPSSAAIYGRSDAVNAAGVLGEAHVAGPGGVPVGVWGRSSPEGFAGFFEGRGHFESAVGIGTLTPTEQLSVYGGILVDGAGTAAGPPPNNQQFPGIRFGAYTSGEGIASNRPLGSTNRDGLDFYTGRTPRMSITNDGKVGIGTTEPTSRLHVLGGVRASCGAPDPNVPTDSGFSFSDDGGTGLFSSSPSHVDLFVDGERAFQLAQETIVIYDMNLTSVNLLAGSAENFIAGGVTGATIAGGGGKWDATPAPNRVLGQFGTVGGGLDNQAGVAGTQGMGATVAGGAGNNAGGAYSTVAGGARNIASGPRSTIGGGNENDSLGDSATVSGGLGNIATEFGTVVGGGYSNRAEAFGALVAGGYQNSASHDYATVAGGYNNVAGGAYSFAAGSRSHANHAGAFVWSDAGATSFSSTGDNQFLVQAAGGVGINKNNPVPGALDVAGPGFFRDSVGIATTQPAAGLHVVHQPAAAAGTLALEGATHTFMSFYPVGFGNGRKAWLGFEQVGAIDLTIMNEMDGGDIRLVPADGGNVVVPCGVVSCSDARFKKNVESIDGALALLERLRPVRFDWRADEFPGRGFSDERQVGFIAQEIAEALPECVSQDSDGYYAVDYAKLTPALTAALQELRAETARETKVLQQQVQQLQAENAALRAAQDELNARLERIESLLK